MSQKPSKPAGALRTLVLERISGMYNLPASLIPHCEIVRSADGWYVQFDQQKLDALPENDRQNLEFAAKLVQDSYDLE